MKICSKCKKEKFDGEFSQSQFKKKSGWCKICIKEYNSIYREENKNEAQVYAVSYYQENKEKIKQDTKEYRIQHEEDTSKYQKRYHKENKIHLHSYSNEYQKERRRIDPLFKLRQNISHAVGMMLKQSNSSKNKESILEYLQYSIDQLKEHIESRFEPWMTWNNYGQYDSKTWDDNDPNTWTWQLDHIKPHSTFKYTAMSDDNFKKCWALSNLRPLSAKQNQMDGATRARH